MINRRGLLLAAMLVIGAAGVTVLIIHRSAPSHAMPPVALPRPAAPRPAGPSSPRPARHSPRHAGPSSARSLTQRLSLAQLAGQRIVFAYAGLQPPPSLLSAVRAGEAGGVIFSGPNIASPGQLREVIAELQNA